MQHRMRAPSYSVRDQMILVVLLAVVITVFFASDCFAGLLSDSKKLKTPSRWKVTQWGSSDDVQKTFYTIVSSTGKLAVIDGGWEQDADLVRSVIRSLGNDVSAWIITHPHPDHVGAFNAILSDNYTGIRIRRIYTVNVNRGRYAATARSYDDFSTYETFSSLTRAAGNLVFLRENDVFDLIGLKCKVLNAWDSYVDRQSVNLCNNGSLVFRISGKKKSMLFCSDVQTAMEKRLLKRHKKELPSTYVQCAHHGNWALSSKFYRYVKPAGAFIDAPPFITEDTTGYYTAPSLIRYFQSKGIKVFSLSGKEHTVTLR